MTDWGIANPLAHSDNNTSTVNYPGVGNVPSPGGAGGELSDMEGLYARLQGSSLQVLQVTSADTAAYSSIWSRYYRMGDLFIDIGHNGSYDFGLVNTNTTSYGPWSKFTGSGYTTFDHSAAPGTLFALDSANDLAGIVGLDRGGYGNDANVRTAANPWAIDEGNATATGAVATVATATFNYGTVAGKNENDTHFTEWTIPVSFLGLTAGEAFDMYLHTTIECGNDVNSLLIHETVPGDDNIVPEPLTMASIFTGLVSLGGYLRRRAKA